MRLVDLRGREDDDAVRALVGTVESGATIVGLEADAVLAACAVVAREGSDVRIVAIGGERERLLDELGAVVNARRLVAVDGCLLRELDATPAPEDAVRATTLSAVERAIRASWSAETSAYPDRWSAGNPALGQCDVTALMVRELFGGETVIANVIRSGERLERHVWNRLPGGIAVDLTREQYRDGERFGTPRVEEPLRLARGRERFELFATRVRAALL